MRSTSVQTNPLPICVSYENIHLETVRNQYFKGKDSIQTGSHPVFGSNSGSRPDLTCHSSHGIVELVIIITPFRPVLLLGDTQGITCSIGL
jgi:hypothetical protein